MLCTIIHVLRTFPITSFVQNQIELDRMSNFFTICPKAHLMSFLTASWYVANILSFDPGIASETVEMNIGRLG